MSVHQLHNKMLVVLYMVVVVTTVTAAATTSQHQQHYPGFSPIHENCTQNLVELLLLRQEVHLSRLLDTETAMADTLTTLAQTVNELKDAVLTKQKLQQTLKTECESPWSIVGENCLLLALAEKLSWAAARQYCSARGGDLVVFRDANTFAEILGYINSVNSENLAVGAWVGGGDEEVEGVWRWITGEAMPRGPPFWGSIDGYKPEPGNGRTGNCGILWHPDKYYLHDISCTYNAAPLCQKALSP